MQLGIIETAAVNENAAMFSETLAVVRGDDQPGFFQNPTPVQLVDSLPSCSSRSAMQSS